MSNTLYYGDNLQVLRDRIASESIDLIYLDPPFNSNRNYFILFKDRTGKASAAQEEAFADTWTWTEESEVHYRELVISCPNRDVATLIQALRTVLHETPMMAYLVAMSIRLFEMHRTLKATGCLYLHCDPTASHYLKLLLDVIFEPRNFQNEIIWQRTGAHNDAKRWGRVTDTILYYTKSSAHTFLPVRTGYSEAHLTKRFRYVDDKGRKFWPNTCLAPGGRGPSYEWNGHTRNWRFTEDRLKELDKHGDIYYSEKGMPYRKNYLEDLAGQPVQNLWTDIVMSKSGAERLGYPTQKPLALLERIIAASSKPGDTILDPFCGCGTAVVAAHRLNRQWIGIDITAVAVGIMKTRLEQVFPDLKGKVVIDGFPRDMESAQTLFEQDPYRFQVWACTLIDAYPLMKKGADSGIDGWRNFLDLDDSSHKAVVQVKGGKVSVSQIRDFCHVITREKATLGFFLCMGDVTKPMKDEAVKEGFWTNAGGRDYPRVQILTVSDVLTGVSTPRFPPQDKVSMLGYKAAQQQKQGMQKELFTNP